jgi:hypothetical protein
MRARKRVNISSEYFAGIGLSGSYLSHHWDASETRAGLLKTANDFLQQIVIT